MNELSGGTVQALDENTITLVEPWSLDSPNDATHSIKIMWVSQSTYEPFPCQTTGSTQHYMPFIGIIGRP